MVHLMLQDFSTKQEDAAADVGGCIFHVKGEAWNPSVKETSKDRDNLLYVRAIAEKHRVRKTAKAKHG